MDEHKGIVKFNGGRGAILCNKCRVIIKSGLTSEDFEEAPLSYNFCDDCNGLGLGVYIGLEDVNGYPIHIGDVLEFDVREWGSSEGNVFTVTLEKGDISGCGVPSEWPSFCRIIKSWNGSNQHLMPDDTGDEIPMFGMHAVE